MGHEQAAELLGAYAVDAVDAEEAEAIEGHVSGCDLCRQELCEHWEALGELAARAVTGVRDTSEGLERAWSRVAAEVRLSTAALPVRQRAPRSPSPPAGRWAAWRAPRLAAAAAVLLIAALGWQVVAQRGQLHRVPGSVEGAYEAALRDPAARRAELSAPGSAPGSVSSRGAVVVLEPDGQGYVSASGVQAESPGRTLQLWALSDSRPSPVSAGVLGAHPGVVAFHYTGPVDAFAVTEEGEGGATQPSRSPLLSGRLA